MKSIIIIHCNANPEEIAIISAMAFHKITLTNYVQTQIGDIIININ